jgi:hypothetical protein
MFTFKLDGESYGIRFQYRGVRLVRFGQKGHEHFQEVDRDVGHDSIRTVCQILKLNDEDRTSELICDGQVTCTLTDNFSKIEGRRRSLTKALADGAQGWHPSKNDRKQIWEAYFANHNDLRPKKRIPAACELCPNTGE